MKAHTLLLIACALALAVTSTKPANAAAPTPPPVPPNLVVPAPSEVFFEGRAVGTRSYICLPSGTLFFWTSLAPQATLFNARDKQLTTHFLSPNPVEGGVLRQAWQHSRDTSTLWAAAIASSTDPAFVAPGATPWRLLRIVGAQDGPTGRRKLTATTFIEEVNTSGGLAPTTGCSQAGDVGKREFVPFTADHFFYREN